MQRANQPSKKLSATTPLLTSRRRSFRLSQLGEPHVKYLRTLEFTICMYSSMSRDPPKKTALWARNVLRFCGAGFAVAGASGYLARASPGPEHSCGPSEDACNCRMLFGTPRICVTKIRPSTQGETIIGSFCQLLRRRCRVFLTLHMQILVESFAECLAAQA